MTTIDPDSLAYPELVNKGCTDDSACIYYVGVHAISENDYLAAQRSFFAPKPVPNPKSFTPFSNVELDCLRLGIVVDFDPTNSDSNDEIDVVVQLIQTANFSIHLFRGINLLFAPDSINFTKIRKTINGAQKDSIAFVAVKNGVIIYRGDLTNMIP